MVPQPGGSLAGSQGHRLCAAVAHASRAAGPVALSRSPRRCARGGPAWRSGLIGAHGSAQSYGSASGGDGLLPCRAVPNHFLLLHWRSSMAARSHGSPQQTGHLRAPPGTLSGLARGPRAGTPAKAPRGDQDCRATARAATDDGRQRGVEEIERTGRKGGWNRSGEVRPGAGAP